MNKALRGLFARKLFSATTPIQVFYGFSKEQQPKPYITYHEFYSGKASENSRETMMEVNIWHDSAIGSKDLAQTIVDRLHKAHLVAGARLLWISTNDLPDPDPLMHRTKVVFKVTELY